MKRKSHHQLTLQGRISIQTVLLLNKSIINIAKQLDVAKQTIYRELKRNSLVKQRKSSSESNCKHRRKCVHLKGILGDFYPCLRRCEKYEGDVCSKISRYPFICNSCTLKKKCIFEKRYYDVAFADKRSQNIKINSRIGIHITKEDFNMINSLITPLIRNGQSLHHIFVNHPEISLSENTIRNWIRARYMTVSDLDLPKVVRFKVKKQYAHRKVRNPSILKGRTYQDYQQFTKDNPQSFVVQIDTVFGKKNDQNCLLTIHFKDIHFMFGFLISSLSPNYINDGILQLRNNIGVTLFQKLFSVILCDNVFEFLKLSELEFDEWGECMCKVFHCDPYRSNQKGACERNHELIRYIKAKGQTLDDLTQVDVDIMFSHINSLYRKSILGHCPYDLALNFLGDEFLSKINIIKIPPDDIILKPKLIKKYVSN